MNTVDDDPDAKTVEEEVYANIAESDPLAKSV